MNGNKKGRKNILPSLEDVNAPPPRLPDPPAPLGSSAPPLMPRAGRCGSRDEPGRPAPSDPRLAPRGARTNSSDNSFDDTEEWDENNKYEVILENGKTDGSGKHGVPLPPTPNGSTNPANIQLHRQRQGSGSTDLPSPTGRPPARTPNHSCRTSDISVSSTGSTGSGNSLSQGENSGSGTWRDRRDSGNSSGGVQLTRRTSNLDDDLTAEDYETPVEDLRKRMSKTSVGSVSSGGSGGGRERMPLPSLPTDKPKPNARPSPAAKPVSGAPVAPPRVPEPDVRDQRPAVLPRTSNDPDRALREQSWYFGDIDRTVCEQRIQAIGRDGCFVIRPSRTGGASYPYAITVLHNSHIYNLRIRLRDDHKYAIGDPKPYEHVFDSVIDMVSFHKNNPLKLIADKSRDVPDAAVKLSVSPSKT